MNKNTQYLTRIFKTLSDGNRLKILLFIDKKERKSKEGNLSCRNESCIKDLAKSLNLTAPTISYHIKELVNADLIITKKEGKWVYCKINRKAFDGASIFIGEFLNNKGKN